MDEFRRRPINKVQQPQGDPVPTPINTPSQPPVASVVSPQPLENPTGITPTAPRKSKKKAVFWSLGVLLGAILLGLGGAWAWFSVQLSPVDSSMTDKKVIKIESGSTPAGIAKALSDEKVIRSELAFLWYARFTGVQNTLQAGTYRLSPSESTPEIIDHLSKGNVDTFTITFLPGATLKANREVFIGAGYSPEEVDRALAKKYDSPLFAGKPVTTDLEGYIYGETYSFGTEATVESILEHVFEQYYGVVQKNNLVARFAAQDMSLYQGITLASIIQREASPQGDDMAQIAQVFYRRLAIDMPLGSDVTYQYIADKMGVPRSPDLDSPYNTRRYVGLPPGPISVPGEKALIAAAHPAEGDYLYFLSGDDDITYFARSLEEHEANIQNHCQEKCQIL